MAANSDTPDRVKIVLQQQTPNTPQVSLQKMSPGDANELANAFVNIAPWSHYPFKLAALTQYLACDEPQAPRYKLASEGRLAGAIGVRWRWLRGPYIQFLGVLPDFQGQGLGQLMLAWLEGTARAEGDANIWVTASDFNAGALRFYERHGFKRIAILDDLVQTGRDEVLLRKPL